jgi:carbon-monoxide dehydrogenase medium subunit
MKAAAFDYVRADSLAHALDLLARHGEGAQLLAGGQSLLPALNLRLLAPDVLIDISRLENLRSITLEEATVRIGALTRHVDLMTSDVMARECPLVVEAVRHVAHPAIRNRGTIGGNLAQADPASELPAVMVALEAVIVLTGPAGERRVVAEGFFTSIYETALRPGELITAVEIPRGRPDERTGFAELARRSGDYALAGLACRLRLAPDGTAADARLAFFAVGDRPMLATAAAARLVGRSPSPDVLAEAQAALDIDLAPTDDLQASGATRLKLARVLLARVVAPLLPGLTAEGRAA